MSNINLVSIDQLADQVNSLVKQNDVNVLQQVIKLLRDNWGEFDLVRCEENKEEEKLFRPFHFKDMIDVTWKYPILQFKMEYPLEYLNSKYVLVQQWEINIGTKQHELISERKRMRVPNQPRLDVKPIAAEVASKIKNKQEDFRLKWYEDGSVKVLTNKIIPKNSGYNRTVEGRRNRFYQSLADHLQDTGWKSVNGVYRYGLN